MIVVARDQHEGVNVAIGKLSLAGNLSAIVNDGREEQVQIGRGRNKGVQVKHGPVLPQKAADGTWSSRIADHLTLRIDAQSDAEGIAFQGSKIGRHAILPEERVPYFIAWKARKADNFPGLVNPECITKSSTKRAQIFHSFSLAPTKRVGRSVSGQVG